MRKQLRWKLPLRWWAGIFMIVTISAPAASLPARLRCENLVAPLGVAEPQPRLSWEMESSQRAQRQTAWRIIVSSSPALLARDTGDLWDRR